MRLKNMDGGHLSVRNGNPDVLNSPKRLNTVQNSNLNYNPSTVTRLLTDDDVNNATSTTGQEGATVPNNIDNAEVRWCTPASREIRNNANNRIYNINNTLAVSLTTPTRHRNASSICSESSPDDSLLDYEEAHQSCSSVDTSPQEEDRGFDYSDTDSEEGNLNHRRGIVNPNYPGFQHLAHTLDYIKASSDSDDDELEVTSDPNNINNNNEEDTTLQIDSVNRLDSVENIQKVFYDKPVFDICANANETQQIALNIRTDEKDTLISKADQTQNIIGDFGEEIAREFGRIFDPTQVFESQAKVGFEEKIKDPKYLSSLKIFEDLEESVHRLCNLDGNKDAVRLDWGSKRELRECLPVEKFKKSKDEFVSSIGEYKFETSKELGRISPEDLDKLNAETIKDLENQLERFQELKTIQEDFNSIKEDVNKLTRSIEEEILFSKPKTRYNLERDFSTTDLDSFETKRAIQKELEEAAEKLTQTKDLEPSATKYNIQPNVEQPFNKAQSTQATLSDSQIVPNMTTINKLTDAFLSNAQDKIPTVEIFKKYEPPIIKARRDSNREEEENVEVKLVDEVEKFCKEDKTKDEKEKDEDSAVPRKKEKIDYVKKRRDHAQQIGSLITIPRRDGTRNRDPMNRRSVPMAREKKRPSQESFGSFDVYNIETAMPKIDMEAIESHLRAAREEERRRRTDREEIRRRLAMGNEDDYYSSCDRPGRKPSLQARLQSGMNLQICFMNETASDTESPSSDSECTMGRPKQAKGSPRPNRTSPEKVVTPTRPASLSISQQAPQTPPDLETDFFARQARLQTEARMALAQAKEMARMQMEIERQRQKKSPITEMVRHSMEKVGIPFPEDRRRLSRQILTDMNVAQLQVIVNDLHTQIEILNENLVKFLMDRDDLHMEQDSMLVDIEDLTRFLGAKEQTLKENGSGPNNNLAAPPSPAPSSPLSALNVKPHLHRIASFVKK